MRLSTYGEAFRLARLAKLATIVSIALPETAKRITRLHDHRGTLLVDFSEYEYSDINLLNAIWDQAFGEGHVDFYSDEYPITHEIETSDFP